MQHTHTRTQNNVALEGQEDCRRGRHRLAVPVRCTGMVAPLSWPPPSWLVSSTALYLKSLTENTCPQAAGKRHNKVSYRHIDLHHDRHNLFSSARHRHGCAVRWRKDGHVSTLHFLPCALQFCSGSDVFACAQCCHALVDRTDAGGWRNHPKGACGISGTLWIFAPP
jgi:hypothetical protein